MYHIFVFINLREVRITIHSLLPKFLAQGLQSENILWTCKNSCLGNFIPFLHVLSLTPLQSLATVKEHSPICASVFCPLLPLSLYIPVQNSTLISFLLTSLWLLWYSTPLQGQRSVKCSLWPPFVIFNIWGVFTSFVLFSILPSTFPFCVHVLSHPPLWWLPPSIHYQGGLSNPPLRAIFATFSLFTKKISVSILAQDCSTQSWVYSGFHAFHA